MPDDSRVAPEATGVDAEFQEALYLRAYPDVAGAIERGELRSGKEHYDIAGRLEGRLFRAEYRDQLLLKSGKSHLMRPGPATSIDRLVASESGAILLIGWTDDRRCRLTEIVVYASDQRRVWRKFPRLRRSDVEAVVEGSTPHHYGFWAFAAPAGGALSARPSPTAKGLIEFAFSDGSSLRMEQDLTIVSDLTMRDLTMEYFANASYHGNGVIGAFAALDADVGGTLVDYNRMVSADIVRQALIQRFGPTKTRFKASLIVPLYGMHHYHYLQSAVFAGGPGIEDCEFLYVLNSPELVEPLTREMRIAAMVYGHAQTLIVLPGNAGFGAANNVAARFARSRRLICVNPDVFPKDPAWARLHAEIVETLPVEQSRFFGTTLYYDDGSLMHGGMYIERDESIASDGDGLMREKVLRVEHHGKGAPDWAAEFAASRPVTAVTGAFISIDRDWFEGLDGFSETYIYGHYEDADLALKSLRKGAPPWMHRIEMWHLEGKGSVRQPHHAGGSLVNRWLFTRTWDSFVAPDLIGKAPAGLVVGPVVKPAKPAANRRRA